MKWCYSEYLHILIIEWINIKSSDGNDNRGKKNTNDSLFIVQGQKLFQIKTVLEMNRVQL